MAKKKKKKREWAMMVVGKEERENHKVVCAKEKVGTYNCLVNLSAIFVWTDLCLERKEKMFIGLTFKVKRRVGN